MSDGHATRSEQEETERFLARWRPYCAAIIRRHRGPHVPGVNEIEDILQEVELAVTTHVDFPRIRGEPDALQNEALQRAFVGEVAKRQACAVARKPAVRRRRDLPVDFAELPVPAVKTPADRALDLRAVWMHILDLARESGISEKRLAVANAEIVSPTRDVAALSLGMEVNAFGVALHRFCRDIVTRIAREAFDLDLLTEVVPPLVLEFRLHMHAFQQMAKFLLSQPPGTMSLEKLSLGWGAAACVAGQAMYVARCFGAYRDDIGRCYHAAAHAFYFASSLWWNLTASEESLDTLIGKLTLEDMNGKMNIIKERMNIISVVIELDNMCSCHQAAAGPASLDLPPLYQASHAMFQAIRAFRPDYFFGEGESEFELTEFKLEIPPSRSLPEDMPVSRYFYTSVGCIPRSDLIPIEYRCVPDESHPGDVWDMPITWEIIDSSEWAAYRGLRLANPPEAVDRLTYREDWEKRREAAMTDEERKKRDDLNAEMIARCNELLSQIDVSSLPQGRWVQEPNGLWHIEEETGAFDDYLVL